MTAPRFAIVGHPNKGKSSIVATLAEDDAVAEGLIEQVTPRTSPALAVGLVEALTKGRARSAGKAILSGLPRMTPGGRSAALRALLGRADWTADLLDAVGLADADEDDLDPEILELLEDRDDAGARRRPEEDR